MTLDHDLSACSLERLGPAQLAEVFAFLDQEPVVNVYLLALAVRDALAQPRDEFWAARRDGELIGLLHLGSQSGAVLPIAEDPAALRLLAAQAEARRAFLPRRFQVIGPRAAVLAVTERLQDRGIAPRLHRRQLYMSLSRPDLPTFQRLPELRRATRDDYDLVLASGAALRNEELEEDPLVADPLAYSRRVEEECRDGYTYLWTDAAGLCFRASVSAMTQDAAQVSGVYVPPERRGRGLGRRGLSEMSARLLERSGAVCLFVNDFNAPALALYRAMGFGVLADWASAFYA